MLGLMTDQEVEVDALGMTKAEYTKKIEKLGIDVATATKDFHVARAENGTKLLDAYIKRIEAHPGLKEVGAKQFKVIEELKAKINDKGDDGLFTADIEAWKAEVGAAEDQLNTIIGVFDGASDAAMNVRKSMNAAGQKSTSPFDAIIRDAKVVEERFAIFEKSMEDLGWAKESKEYKEFLKVLNDKMGTPAFAVENAAKFTEHLETARKTYLTTAADVKKLTTQHKLLNKVAESSGTLEAFKAQAKAADNVLQRRIEGQEAELTGLFQANANAEEFAAYELAKAGSKEEFTKFLAQETDLNDKVAKQIAERLELLEQEKTEHQKTFENEVARIEALKAQLDVQKQLAAAQKTQLANAMKLHEAELQLEKAQNTNRALRKGIDATPGDQLRTFLKFANLRQKQALSEFNLATKRIKLERGNKSC